MDNTYFIFREAESLDELRSLLCLRYKIYRESRIRGFVTKNEYGIDLDCYDLRARHYGLFRHDLSGFQPVGYHRFVQESYGPMWQEVAKLTREFPSLYEQAQLSPRVPFPMMSHAPGAETIWGIYSNLKAAGESMVEEATRFSLDATIRSVALARHIIESDAAIQFYSLNFDHVIMACTESHRNFYDRYGFRKLKGVLDCDVNGVHLTCVMASAGFLHYSVRDRIMRMANVFLETGCICYYPHDPEYYYPPFNIHRTEQYPIAMAA